MCVYLSGISSPPYSLLSKKRFIYILIGFISKTGLFLMDCIFAILGIPVFKHLCVPLC